MRVSQGFGGTREHWQNIEGNKGTWAYFGEQGTETVQIRRRKHFGIRNKERYFWDFILFTNVIGFVYFAQEITKTQTKSRLSAGSLCTRLRGSSVGGNLLSQIAKMSDRSFADRVVLPVNAASFRNCEEKPAVRWSFEMGIGDESEKMLFDFIFRVRKVFIVHCSTGCL